MTQDFFDTVSLPEWRPLIFAMCFLHSLVQVLVCLFRFVCVLKFSKERRKYGPLGWNVPCRLSLKA